MDLSRLFGNGLYRVLRAFHRNKQNKLNFREVCRLANLTPPATKQHLEKAVELGILKVEDFKNLKLYYPSKSRVLASIFSMLDEEYLTDRHDFELINSVLERVDADIIMLMDNEILLVNNEDIGDVILKPTDKFSFRFLKLENITDEVRKKAITIKNGEAFYQL